MAVQLYSFSVPYFRISILERFALVQVDHHPDIMKIVDILQSYELEPDLGKSTLKSGIRICHKTMLQAFFFSVVTASDVDLKVLKDKKPMKKADLKELERIHLPFLENLEDSGFFQVIGSKQATPRHTGKTFASLDINEFKTIFR